MHPPEANVHRHINTALNHAEPIGLENISLSDALKDPLGGTNYRIK